MGAAISMQLREAIVRTYGSGRYTYDEIASLLGVGRATVNRVLRLKRETGATLPRARGGGNVSPIHGRIAELLVDIVGTMPDATVTELTDALMDKGRVTTSRSSVVRALQRLGFSRKKSRS
jgi:transposase